MGKQLWHVKLNKLGHLKILKMQLWHSLKLIFILNDMLTGKKRVFISLVIRRFINIQNANSSSFSTLLMRVLAMKFIPWQYPTSGRANPIACSTRLSSSYPSYVRILSDVWVLFRSLDISSLTFSHNYYLSCSINDIIYWYTDIFYKFWVYFYSYSFRAS